MNYGYLQEDNRRRITDKGLTTTITGEGWLLLPPPPKDELVTATYSPRIYLIALEILLIPFEMSELSISDLLYFLINELYL